MPINLPFLRSRPRVAVIRLQGVIAAQGRGAALNDAQLAPAIEKAFRRGKPKAVALAVNSPGGSPVQSSLIAARIRRLAGERGVPVYGFVEDVAASGGYWLATAADEIFADEASILGSIGVISAGFGFHELIARYGIERRLYTAGQSKSLLDPFQAEKPEDVARLRAIQDPVHESFIAQVRARRGAKLDEEADLFTGEVFVGAQAVKVGLADGIGHLVATMKARFGDRTRFSVYGPKKPLLQRMGAEALAGAADGVEERAALARFGL